VEICRVTFVLNVDKSSTISPEGKLDTCGSVSLSHFSHLQQVKDCRKYDIRELVLSGIGRKPKPLKQQEYCTWKQASVGKVKKILCHSSEKWWTRWLEKHHHKAPMETK
jgi:hypothetical protein